METKTLDIPVILPDYYGDCDRCVDRLKQAIIELDGVSEVAFDMKLKSLSLAYDSNVVTMDRIQERVGRLGVEVKEKYIHKSYKLVGLDCPDCAMKLEKAIGRLNGVLWSSLNYATSILSVEFEQHKTDSDILKRIKDLGYDVELPQVAGGTGQPARSSLMRNKVLAAGISGLFLAAGLIASWQGVEYSFVRWLYVISIISGGFYTARAGILSLRAITFDTNLLVTLAAIGAVAIGEWSEAASVMFLFALGSALEAFTVERTRNSIKGLMELSPKEASVIRNGREMRVSVEEVCVGETIIVRPGDRIPMDGVVVNGLTSVDESAITGESVPSEKTVGSTVYAGTINQRGSLDIRVTRLVGDDTLSRIISLVEEAQAMKAPSQQFSERFGRVYTPIVVGIAVLLSIVALVARDFEWFRRALVLLVVSCPCALVISTPVAIVAAIGNAARNGVLVKGGAHLEELGRVSVVAFDKTGTLTAGKLVVTDVIPISDASQSEILRIAASIEDRSEHPLAEAILKRAADDSVPLNDLSYFEAIPGMGARGVLDSQACYVGNQRLLASLNIQLNDNELIDRLRSEGKTIVFVLKEDVLLGIIAAADVLRESSTGTIAELKKSGIKKTIMLTGDSQLTAHAVARTLGIDGVEADLLPEDKVDRVRHLVSRYGKVAMVGDGINDAPALAVSTVGVAMGGAGTHTALETADVVLMADDLSRLPYGMRLSNKALRIIRTNIAFSVSVVVLLVALTLSGTLNLTAGIFGHEGSALLVIANGMRLLRMRA